MKERLIKHWITSGLGLILIAFVIFKFIVNFDKLPETLAGYLPYGIGVLIGLIFFVLKDTQIRKIVLGQANKLDQKIK